MWSREDLIYGTQAYSADLVEKWDRRKHKSQWQYKITKSFPEQVPKPTSTA